MNWNRIGIFAAWSALLFPAAASAQDEAKSLIDRAKGKERGGDFDGAAADYARAIEVDPSTRDAYLKLADLKADVGDLEAGIAALSKYLDRSPRDVEALQDRGALKRRKGDRDGALADYSRAIEVSDKPALAYDARAHARFAMGDLEGALSDFTRAVELDAAGTHSNACRSFVRIQKGDRQGALDDIDRALGFNASCNGCNQDKARANYYLRIFTDGLAAFRKACELDSRFKEGRLWIWLIRARLGEREAATRELKAFLSSVAIDAANDWFLKQGRFLTGELAEADLFKAADGGRTSQAKADRRIEAHWLAGTVRLIGGDPAGAEDHFRKCLQSGIRSSHAGMAAVAELQAMGKWKEAEPPPDGMLERLNLAWEELQEAEKALQAKGASATNVDRLRAENRRKTFLDLKAEYERSGRTFAPPK